MALERIDLGNGEFKIQFYFLPHDAKTMSLFGYETPPMKIDPNFVSFE